MTLFWFHLTIFIGFCVTNAEAFLFSTTKYKFRYVLTSRDAPDKLFGRIIRPDNCSIFGKPKLSLVTETCQRRKCYYSWEIPVGLAPDTHLISPISLLYTNWNKASVNMAKTALIGWAQLGRTATGEHRPPTNKQYLIILCTVWCKTRWVDACLIFLILSKSLCMDGFSKSEPALSGTCCADPDLRIIYGK